MDEKDRKVLRENRTMLIRDLTDLEGICDFLLEKNVLTNNMVQEILAEKTPNSKARKLLDTIPKRGPTAFKLFCESLLHTDQDHIARMLNPNIKVSGVTPVPAENGSCKKSNVQPPTKAGNKNQVPVPVQVPIKVPASKVSESTVTSSSSSTKPGNKGHFSAGTRPISSPSPEERVPVVKGKTNTPLFDDERIFKMIRPQHGWPEQMDLSLSSPEFKVEEVSEEDVNNQLEQDRYPMSKDLTKRALIICNRDYDNESFEDRKIADMDSFRLVQVLKQFGFNVENATSLNGEKLIRQLDKEKTQDDAYSIFMLVILSYGGKGTIICTDGKEVNIQDIVNMFSAKNCPLMSGVPKLFLIQACGVKIKDMEQGGDAPESSEAEQMKSIETSLSNIQLQSPALTGNTTDTHASMHTSSSEQSLSDPLNLENNNDILVAMATTADIDHDRKQYSSQFLLGLSHMLCHYAKSEHFINLLNGINRLKKGTDSEEPMKLCEYKHSLTKKLFLMPTKKC